MGIFYRQFYKVGVGWKFILNESPIENAEEVYNNKILNPSQKQIYIPLFSKIMCGKLKLQFLCSDEANVDFTSLLEKSEGRIIFNQHVSSLAELSHLVINYLLSLSQRNTTRSVINTNLIEELIDRDFLDMIEDQ